MTCQRTLPEGRARNGMAGPPAAGANLQHRHRDRQQVAGRSGRQSGSRLAAQLELPRTGRVGIAGGLRLTAAKRFAIDVPADRQRVSSRKRLRIDRTELPLGAQQQRWPPITTPMVIAQLADRFMRGAAVTPANVGTATNGFRGTPLAGQLKERVPYDCSADLPAMVQGKLA